MGLQDSFDIHLRANRRSDETRRAYLRTLRAWHDWLDDQGLSPDPRTHTRQDIEGFLAYLSDRLSPNSVRVAHTALSAWFTWLSEPDEGELTRSPMERVKPPPEPDVVTRVLSPDELKRMFAVLKGNEFQVRRDAAILWLLLDSGMRRGDLSELLVEHVDMKRQHISIVRSKGGKARIIAFGDSAGRALDRYLRARVRHPAAGLPDLWLGQRGRLGAKGVYGAIKHVAKLAGVEDVHPHTLRHTFADAWLEAGGQEGDLMELAGWSNRKMLDRYGRSQKQRRALTAHKRFSPGDRL
jgi:site-specific recombinase XerD